MSPDEPHPEFEEEPDLLPSRTILKVIGGAVVVAIGLCLIAWAGVAIGIAKLRPSRQFPEEKLGAPHRVAGIHQEPFELKDEKPSLAQTQLDSLAQFGWVDRKQGVVRIPIERAIDWVASDPARINGPAGRPALRKKETR